MKQFMHFINEEVLILIVVDDGLVQTDSWRHKSVNKVLILIVVDDGRVPETGARTVVMNTVS